MRKRSYRYLKILSTFLLLSFAVLSCMDRATPRPVRSAIVEVQQAHAPDKRVALFDIKSHSQDDTVFLSGETNLPEAYASLIQKIEEKGIIYVDDIQLLPDPALPSKGVVNVSVANIRFVPKHSGELSTQSTLGTGLKVYKQEGDWFYVQTPDGYLGWLEKGAFILMDDIAYQDWLKAEKIIFTADYGFVQDAASPQSGRISDLVSGDILLSEGVSGSYRAVAFPDGRRGYVPNDLISEQSDWLGRMQQLSVPAVINTALTFTGRPYLWGGTSGKGMDCSGFTKTVYFLNGFVLPRDASQQVHAGVEVPTDSTFRALQSGDFVFFGEKATGGEQEKVRHVGIYLGQGQFIHSGADNPGVRIESLLPDSPNFAAHRRKSFLRARRMELGSPGVVPVTDLPDFYGPLPDHQLIQ